MGRPQVIDFRSEETLDMKISIRYRSWWTEAESEKPCYYFVACVFTICACCSLKKGGIIVREAPIQRRS